MPHGREGIWHITSRCVCRQHLLPRLGLARDQWGQQMARAGVMTGNVLGAYANRRTLAGTGRMASDKSGLFEDGI